MTKYNSALSAGRTEVKKLIAMFFGKPTNKEFITKYLLIQTNLKGVVKKYDTEIQVPDSLVCLQFNSKKEMDEYKKTYLSKHDLSKIETYVLSKE